MAALQSQWAREDRDERLLTVLQWVFVALVGACTVAVVVAWVVTR